MNKQTSWHIVVPRLDCKLLTSMQVEHHINHVSGFYATIWQLCYGHKSSLPPVAAMTAMMEGLPSTGYWLRADPVRLIVDLVHIYFAGQEALDLSTQEVSVFVNDINAYFAEYGVTLHAPTPSRWYLHCDHCPQIECPDPLFMEGQSIRDYLPTGPEGQLWRRHLSHLQMLLNSHPLNQARRDKSLPTLDSLWLWGGGVLPTEPVAAQWQGMMTDSLFVKSLAKINQQNVLPCSVDRLNEALQIAAEPGRYLLCFECLTQEKLQKQLVEIISQKLCLGHVGEVQLYTSDGSCYHLTKKNSWSWWQRCKSLLSKGNSRG